MHRLCYTSAALSCAMTVAACATAAAPANLSKQPEPDSCSIEARKAQGGSFLEANDGVPIWYRTAGNPSGHTVVYLHGGPGYNTYVFEQSAGKLLESRFHMVYLDQRGCGRSGFDGPSNAYGMGKTVADIELLRETVGAETVHLIGHSFGGLVAVEYAQRFPDSTGTLILVDTMPDVGRALEYQVSYIHEISTESFPDKASQVHEIAGSDATPFEKLGNLYGVLGRIPLQAKLHYADPKNQDTMEAIDSQLMSGNCTDEAVVAAYQREGYLSESTPTIAKKLTRPALLIAGTASHVIGQDNIKHAADTWGVRTEQVEAGHFVYFERPDEFVGLVANFVGNPVSLADTQAP